MDLGLVNLIFSILLNVEKAKATADFPMMNGQMPKISIYLQR